MSRLEWYTRGRQPVAVLNPNTRHHITSSKYFMNTVARKPLLWVVEQLIEIRFVGGLTGTQAEHFLCLLFRLLQIHPAPDLVLAMLHQDVHKYLRVAALVCIRLLGSTAILAEARQIGFDDYRKIRVYGQINTKAQSDLTASTTVVAQLGAPPSSNSSQKFLEEQTDVLFAGKKRLRGESDPGGQSSVTAVGGPVAHYLAHVDEITECLFGTGKVVPNGKKSLGSTHFLGIPLPSLEYVK